MSSTNQSPSYLEQREYVRRWMLNHPDGKIATSTLTQCDGNAAMVNTFDDDHFTAFEDMVEDFRGASVLAASNAEAREAFQIAAGARSTKMPAPGGHAHWRHISQMPLAYVLRKQLETGDMHYWDNKRNLYKELLENPQWSRVPTWYLKGQLEKYLPHTAGQERRGNIIISAA